MSSSSARQLAPGFETFFRKLGLQVKGFVQGLGCSV